MKKTSLSGPVVNIARLKNQLSKYLVLAKEGQELIVLDHKMPIAKVVPYSEGTKSWKVRKPTKALNLRQFLRLPLQKGSTDPVDALLEDRKRR